MLKLKPLSKSEGTWFDFPDIPGVRVKVRMVPASTTISFMYKGSEKEVHFRSFCQMVEAWEGIEIEGNPSEEEQKRAIFEYDPLYLFVLAKSNELREKLEADLKNSVSSQGG
jgi:ADP-ribose pyrophosphatase YjhB (NUDIX family)